MGKVIALHSRQTPGNLPVNAELSPEDKDILLARLLLNLRSILGVDSPASTEKRKKGQVIDFQRKAKSPRPPIASRNAEARKPRAKSKPHRDSLPQTQERPA
jgi:hypothetical protein